MAQTFQIPIPPKGAPALVFPHCCAACGAPKEAESRLVVNRLVMRGKRQVQLNLKYPIPHCTRCAGLTKSVFLAGFIPFALGFLVCGGIAFVVTAFGASALGLDDYGQPNNANSLVIGAAAGLLAGLIGAFLFELIGRVLLLPFYGRALLRAPLLAAQLLSDSDYVAGVLVRPDPDGRQLQLTLSNDTVAHEFATLNVTSINTHA